MDLLNLVTPSLASWLFNDIFRFKKADGSTAFVSFMNFSGWAFHPFKYNPYGGGFGAIDSYSVKFPDSLLKLTVPPPSDAKIEINVLPKESVTQTSQGSKVEILDQIPEVSNDDKTR